MIDRSPAAIAADIAGELEADAAAFAKAGDYDRALTKLRAALAVWKLADDAQKSGDSAETKPPL